MKRLFLALVILISLSLLGKTYILVISSGEFRDERITPLDAALEDGTTFRNTIEGTIETPGGIVELVNPSYTEMLSGTLKWARSGEEEDTLIFYYSGHGYSTEGKTYLIPKDVDIDLLDDTAYDLEKAVELIDEHTEAKNIVMIIDACYAGSLLKDRPISGARIETKQIKDIVEKGRFSFLFSSQPEEVSLESPDGGGYFTYYLVQGLLGEANSNGDESITLNELVAYLSVQVPKITVGRQHPFMLGKDIIIAQDREKIYSTLIMELMMNKSLPSDYLTNYVNILRQEEKEDSPAQGEIRKALLEYARSKDLTTLIIKTVAAGTVQTATQPQTQTQGNCLLKIIAGNELAKSGTVYIDEIMEGTLESGLFEKKDMSSGKHQIVIDGEGIEKIEREITFRFDGEMIGETVIAEPGKGILRVETIPPGARVYIDGEEQQSTSTMQVLIVLGIHDVRVVLEGYREESAKVNLREKDKILTVPLILSEHPSPEKPILTYPSNNSKDIPVGNITLKWESKESDLTYRIEFDGKTYTTKNKSYTVSANERGKTYSWKVVAVNEFGKETTSETYSFTTQSNRAPNIPSSPNPANNATNQPTTITLSWNCSDPDGDSLTYDVYFDTKANPTKVSTSQSGRTLNRSNLSYGTTYYWKVVAKDSKGATTEGPEWRFTTQSAPTTSSYTPSSIVPSMVLVEKGSFTMGDTWGGGDSDEKPTHKVTFTYDFYMGRYEVTFEEYDAFCEATGRSKPNDRGWGRGSRPVFYVSWWDAIAYCNWLSEKENLPKAYDNKGNLLDKDGRVTSDPSKVVGYRLPTEAEWEFAARGGNNSNGYKYSGSDNVDDVAWYISNSGSRTQQVGKKAPNELGIYDMSGNVWEWCSDWYGGYSSSAQTNPYNNSGSYRVARGGSWYSSATGTRVARRSNASPTVTDYDLGFRICRTVPLITL